jgi:phosphate transport system substrate-binding protein
MYNNIIKKTLIGVIFITLILTTLSGCIETEDEGLDIVAVGRDSASGTREFFYENVMDKEDFTDNMLEKNSNGAVHQTISQTKGAIGYVGLGYIDNNIKALKVNGIEPTVANVMSGTYPIARNLNMMTAGEPTGIALEFLNFIDSDDGQAIVGEEGFVPKQSSGPYTTVEGLSGSITIIGSTTVLPIASLAGEAFEALYPGVTIAVSGGGSSVGVTSVGEGTADIGMASREVKSSETEKYPTLVVHVVCSDGIALIVHPDNDYVDGLTVQQVKDIYLGTHTNWNEL